MRVILQSTDTRHIQSIWLERIHLFLFTYKSAKMFGKKAGGEIYRVIGDEFTAKNEINDSLDPIHVSNELLDNDTQTTMEIKGKASSPLR